MTAVVRRIAALTAAVVVLASCRVDVTTSVEVAADGSGSVTVEVVADPDVVEAAPTLAEELRVDDLRDAGWDIDGPTVTDDGGLRLVASHDFTGPAEATQLLDQLNGDRGPYQELAVTRQVSPESVSIIVDGTLAIDGGVRALADAELVDLLGSVPWRDELEARDLTVADALSVRLVVGVPDEDGNPTEATIAVDGGTDAEVFDMPADGSPLAVSTRTVIDLTPDARSAGVAAVAGVALILWLAVSISFTVFVMRARKRRATARLRRLQR